MRRHEPITPFGTAMFSNVLVREVAIALALKLLLLGAIWFAFFRPQETPPSRDAVLERLYGPAQTAHDKQMR
jgi:hypothetical protein